MLKIDTETMTISMTRSDTVNIVFSAVDKNGQEYVPSVGDVLTFSVAKKTGAEPLFQIRNAMEADAETFWKITIQPADTSELKFGDYVFDVQLTHNGEVDTIIGETDTIHPTFRVWGEVATES